MNKWLLGAILALAAHFSASFLVPLDQQAQKTFAGLMKWVWPWAIGNKGIFGPLNPEAMPLPALWAALISATLLIVATLAVVGIWVPFTWWKVAAIAGAVVSIVLMAMFFGPTKVLPIALDIFLIWAIWTDKITVARR